jgi:hypothetical protein
LTSGAMYDVFFYVKSGTPKIDIVKWTSTTARASAVSIQNGIWANTGSITGVVNGDTITAAKATLLGSFYTTSTTQTQDALANRYFVNLFNPVIKPCQSTDGNLESTASSTYVQVGSMSIGYVSCLGNAYVNTTGKIAGQATAGLGVQLAIGSGTTTEATGDQPGMHYDGGTTTIATCLANLYEAPASGLVTRYLLFKYVVGGAGTVYARGDVVNNLLLAGVPC